jgi:bacteriorhodopsin
MGELMVVSALLGALVTSSYKWGYFVFAMMALSVIACSMLTIGLSHARFLGVTIYRAYKRCACWTIFVWLMFPIAWGLSEGGNIISPDSEAIFYGVLDILSKPVFGAILLWAHRNIDPKILGLSTRQHDDAINLKHYEKSGPNPANEHTPNNRTGCVNNFSKPEADITNQAISGDNIAEGSSNGVNAIRANQSV